MVLDTNQLLGKNLDGVALRMVQKVAEQTGHDLVLPEVVAEEYLAHYQHEIGQAVKRVRDGIDDLHHLIPSWTGDTAFLRLVETVAEKSCRDELAHLFRIHPTPKDAWQEALLREAHRRPPAKTSWEKGKPGSGARDAAIWLTTLDACLSSREETYFVTTNSSDFGRGGSLRPELAQELHDRLGQDALFHYCSDIPDLMSQLGIEAVSPPADDMIGSADAVQAAVETALADDQVDFEFIAGIPNFALKSAGAFVGVRDLRFSGRKDKVEAHRIGDDIWACARGAWVGWNECSVFWRPEVVPAAQVRRVRLNFKVNATVVMQLDAKGTIVAAEVTDRSRLVVEEQASE